MTFDQRDIAKAQLLLLQPPETPPDLQMEHAFTSANAPAYLQKQLQFQHHQAKMAGAPLLGSSSTNLHTGLHQSRLSTQRGTKQLTRRSSKSTANKLGKPGMGTLLESNRSLIQEMRQQLFDSHNVNSKR